jgi:hypothetical protein
MSRVRPVVSALDCDVPCRDPEGPLNVDSHCPLGLRPACTGLPRRLGVIGVQMQCAINRRMPGRRHAKVFAEHVHEPGQP